MIHSISQQSVPHQPMSHPKLHPDQILSAVRLRTVPQRSIIVRGASREDGAEITRISRGGFADTHATGFQNAADLTQYLTHSFTHPVIQNELDGEEHTYLVAESRQTIIGTVRLSHEAPPAHLNLRAAVELGRLYLRPGYTGQGIGSTLLLRALEAAQDVGYQTCWLAVWDQNHPAIQFYRRWQFQVAGMLSLTVGQSRLYAVAMARML